MKLIFLLFILFINLYSSNEPLFYQQWSINKDQSFYNDNFIDENAHINANIGLSKYSGKGIKIAVIDDGLDSYHEDLEGAIVSKFSFDSNDSNDVSQNFNDRHGTAVTGIIAARENELGIKGIASDSEIIFLKYPIYISDSQTVELFEKAESFGADIINCSWGTYNVSSIVKEKIISLAKNGRNGKGTIIVFASGNDNRDLGNDESNIPEVLSVGASGKDNLRTSYTNYGENLDILAPGGNYLGITTLDPTGTLGKSISDENYSLYDDSTSFVGTSASAPIISGVVALMLEKNPDLTRTQIEELLTDNADKIGTTPYIDGRNDFYGYGKVNLDKTLNEIIEQMDIIYDINNDGTIDILDIMLVANRWNIKKDADNSYDVKYDFNNDSIIDIIDIMVIVSKWNT